MRVLYVDAGNSHNLIKDRKPFTISLFDETKYSKCSYVLQDLTLNNIEAEYIAVINALLYCKDGVKRNEETIIYSDSQSLIFNKKLLFYCNKNNIKLKWVSRKDNKIADQLSKIKEVDLKKSRKRVRKIFELKKQLEEDYSVHINSSKPKKNITNKIVLTCESEIKEENLTIFLKEKGILENTKEFEFFESYYLKKIEEFKKIKLEVEALAFKEIFQ